MEREEPQVKGPKPEWPKSYIGTKVVKAEPMAVNDFNASQGKPQFASANAPGYKVEYEDGYVSWSPKDVFERCYREITPAERMLI